MPTYALTCHHYAFITVVLWATAYISTKLAVPYISPESIGLIRCLTASAILAAVVAVKRLSLPRRRDAPWFLLSGALGLSLYLLLFNRGVITLSPTTSCIIISTAPIITALLASAIFRERLSWLGWAAIAVSFAGVVVLSLWDGTVSLNIGVFWTQLAAISMGFYNILQRRLTREYAPVLVTACSYFAGALLLLPFFPGAVRETGTAPGWATLLAFGMGVFPGALAYLAWSKAMSIAPKTSYVANYMFLTPFLSLIMEYAIIQKLPDAGTVLGGILILGSMLLFSAAGKNEKT